MVKKKFEFLKKTIIELFDFYLCNKVFVSLLSKRANLTKQ